MLIDIEEHIIYTEDILYVTPIYFNNEWKNYSFNVHLKGNKGLYFNIKVDIGDFAKRFNMLFDKKEESLLFKMVNISIKKLKEELINSMINNGGINRKILRYKSE